MSSSSDPTGRASPRSQLVGYQSDHATPAEPGPDNTSAMTTAFEEGSGTREAPCELSPLWPSFWVREQTSSRAHWSEGFRFDDELPTVQADISSGSTEPINTTDAESLLAKSGVSVATASQILQYILGCECMSPRESNRRARGDGWVRTADLHYAPKLAMPWAGPRTLAHEGRPDDFNLRWAAESLCLWSKIVQKGHGPTYDLSIKEAVRFAANAVRARPDDAECLKQLMRALLGAQDPLESRHHLAQDEDAALAGEDSTVSALLLAFTPVF
ncbi:hypothetical protein CBOM_05637 [Ceraceosorus bombacis]|uniref:Uncharacterized protein n=1 Tax=Ceraceosorus bombacis TaxID=401625 RepID=A0A0P1BQ26_9BASI|nr:hypothetical protein CBOM_05637 [Ceraceosorus bombacis]